MAKTKQATGEYAPLLDKPRILYSEPGSLSQCLFYGALLLLGSAGALGCFFGAFQVPVNPWPALGVGAVCLGFSLFLFSTKRPSWIFSLLGIVLWVLAVWYFFEDLLQGCAHTVNLVLEAYSEKFNLPLPLLAVDPLASPQEIRRQCTLFCCLFTFPYLFFLGWLLVGRKSGLGSFCLTGLMLCFPMFISLVPPTPYLGALLLFWSTLLLISPSFGRRHRLLEDHGKFHATGNGVARLSMLLLFLAGGALCMVLTYFLVPYSTYQRPQIAADLRDGFTQGFGIEAAMEGGVGSGNRRVNLDSLGARSYTGETMLRVKYNWEAGDNGSPNSAGASNFQKDYLKSFVGSVYTGRSWERLPTQEARQLETLLDGMHPQTLLDQFSENFYPDTSQRYTLQVENLEANPRCVYVPYGLTQASVDESLMEYVDDGFLRSTRLFSGTPQYTLDAWGLTQGEIYYPARVGTSILEGYARSQGVERWEEAPGVEDISQQLIDSFASLADSQSPVSVDLWTIPEPLRQYLTPAQQQLTLAAEAYHQFIYDHYTQLPPELEERLNRYLEENHLEFPYRGPYMGFSDNSYTSLTMLAQQVAATLAAQCTYTLTPPPLPQSADFVEFFLFESHQGYCVHFATTAVALFRAMGIPARYAEGYAIPVEDGEWVNVPDYNAHAWVELYLGGVGWVPVEVTPAGPDAPAATENALPMESIQVTPTPTPTPIPTPTPSPTPGTSPSASPTAAPNTAPTPRPGEGQQLGQAASTGWLPWIATLAALLLLVVAALLRRKILLALRHRKFTQPNRNQAALALYAAILDLCQRAETLLPTWQADIPPQLERLALKARFSQHTLTPGELALFRQEWERLTAFFRRELPLAKRLWCMYGLCLF